MKLSFKQVSYKKAHVKCGPLRSNAFLASSQNAEKDTHIKGRLLYQARFSLIASLFKMGNSVKGKNLLPEGANSFL